MSNRKTPMPKAEQAQEAPWISSMREHYVTTGNYRQEDVYRLIGAPWESGEIRVTATGAAASRVSS